LIPNRSAAPHVQWFCFAEHEVTLPGRKGVIQRFHREDLGPGKAKKSVSFFAFQVSFFAMKFKSVYFEESFLKELACP
jgi:hypothetical protein